MSLERAVKAKVRNENVCTLCNKCERGEDKMFSDPITSSQCVEENLKFFFFLISNSCRQIAGKRDVVKDKEAQEWVESLLGLAFPAGESYEDVLKDGQVLCRLINKIKPGSVAKINESGGQFKMMENINNFQKALKAYGVPDQDMFQTVDLYEKKDISQVTNTLFALGRAVGFNNKIVNGRQIFHFYFVFHSDMEG